MADSETSIAGKRCLVLDDEFLIALDIQQILETAGAPPLLIARNPPHPQPAHPHTPQL